MYNNFTNTLLRLKSQPEIQSPVDYCDSSPQGFVLQAAASVAAEFNDFRDGKREALVIGLGEHRPPPGELGRGDGSHVLPFNFHCTSDRARKAP